MTDLQKFYEEWNNGQDLLLVHTSGSTGAPKPLWVEKRRMLNSARITCDFLGIKPCDTALLCLPLDYIAGKMMVVRSIERNLSLTSVTPDNHPLRSIIEQCRQNGTAPESVRITLAAMVPSQVYCSLQDAEERSMLMQIKHLIIGGGSIPSDLEQQLQHFPNGVWSTYGMTETLSHIALRRLNGTESDRWYTPFESVNISISTEEERKEERAESEEQRAKSREERGKSREERGKSEEQRAKSREERAESEERRRGCLIIHAPQVCSHPLTTNDIAELHDDGRRFRIIGRKDNVICSGGIKIQAEEVEETLQQFIPYPIAITRLPDVKFGEIVVLLIGSEREENGKRKEERAESREEREKGKEQRGKSREELEEALKNAFSHLHRYAIPKRIIHTESIPRTETGKTDRAKCLLLALQTATQDQ